MRTPLRPYLLGGGASTALVAAALAAFVSLTTLVSEPALSPSQEPRSEAPAAGVVEVDVTPRAPQGDSGSDRLATSVASLPSAPVSLVVALLAPAPSEAGGGGDEGREERRRGGRSGDGGRRGGRGSPTADATPPPAAPPGLFPTVPPSPVSPETAPRGRRVGQLEGDAAPPGHGGSPPRRPSSEPAPKPTNLSTGTAAGGTGESTKKNGKTPPGSGKKTD